MRKLYLASFDFTLPNSPTDTSAPLWDFRLVVVTEKDAEETSRRYPEWENVLMGRDKGQPSHTVENDAAYVIAAQWFKKRYPDGNASHVSVKPAIEGPIDDTDITCKADTTEEKSEEFVKEDLRVDEFMYSLSEYTFNNEQSAYSKEQIIGAFKHHLKRHELGYPK